MLILRAGRMSLMRRGVGLCSIVASHYAADSFPVVPLGRNNRDFSPRNV